MAQRECEIALSPDLQVSLTEFAAAWNELAETSAIGEARIEKARGEQYDLTILATILITVVGGTAANVLSAKIMEVLEKKGVHKRTHIEHVKKPDGTDSFIADIDE